MAVFTPVSHDTVRQFTRALGVGELVTLRGIESGIENTNYFVTTDRQAYVLTLFERLGYDQLPFYLQLMLHLADRVYPFQSPSRQPVANWCTRSEANQPRW